MVDPNAGLIVATGGSFLVVIWITLCHFEVRAFGFGISPERNLMTALGGMGVIFVIEVIAAIVLATVLNPYREKEWNPRNSPEDLPGWVQY